MSRLHLVILAVALPVSACTRIETPRTSDTTRTPPAVGEARALGATCENDRDGFSVSYPAGWHVYTGDLVPSCSLFDPDSIHVPEASELPIGISVILGFENRSIASLAAETHGRRFASREQVTVGGREAIRRSGETTGEGLYDAGIHFYEYMVDLGGRTLLGTTYSVGSVSFEQKRQIIDAMMKSLRFRDTSP